MTPEQQAAGRRFAEAQQGQPYDWGGDFGLTTEDLVEIYLIFRDAGLLPPDDPGEPS